MVEDSPHYPKAGRGGGARTEVMNEYVKYSIWGTNSDLAVGTYAIVLVDISNTTEYKHKDTTSLTISQVDIHFHAGTSAVGKFEYGFVTSAPGSATGSTTVGYSVIDTVDFIPGATAGVTATTSSSNESVDMHINTTNSLFGTNTRMTDPGLEFGTTEDMRDCSNDGTVTTIGTGDFICLLSIAGEEIHDVSIRTQYHSD